MEISPAGPKIISTSLNNLYLITTCPNIKHFTFTYIKCAFRYVNNAYLKLSIGSLMAVLWLIVLFVCEKKCFLTTKLPTTTSCQLYSYTKTCLNLIQFCMFSSV